MPKFKESNLEFSFPDDWEVKQFDKTQFFKYFSGHGFKGVDFIAITPEGKLILMEVKNYTNQWQAAHINPTDNLKNDLPNFSQKIISKFEDTFHLVKIIHQVYLRKWWFRWFVPPFRKYFSFSFLSKKKWGFWLLVYELIEKKEIELVLWLELAKEVPKKERNQIFIKISDTIHKDLNSYSFKIFNKEKNNLSNKKANHTITIHK